jgi:hypothetical protein
MFLRSGRTSVALCIRISPKDLRFEVVTSSDLAQALLRPMEHGRSNTQTAPVRAQLAHVPVDPRPACFLQPSHDHVANRLSVNLNEPKPSLQLEVLMVLK